MKVLHHKCLRTVSKRNVVVWEGGISARIMRKFLVDNGSCVPPIIAATWDMSGVGEILKRHVKLVV